MKLIKDAWQSLVGRGGNKKRFDERDAKFRFKLLSASGRDGREMRVSFEEGSELILSNYPPGTILREKISMRDTGLYYMWWCVGDQDSETIDLFDANDPDEVLTSKVYFPPMSDDDFDVKKRTFSFNGNYKERPVYSYRIDNGQGNGSLIDDHFDTWVVDESVRPGFLQLRLSRSTERIDIFEMGVKEKNPSSESAKTGVGVLRPVTGHGG